jgi:hypothetical protein
MARDEHASALSALSALSDGSAADEVEGTSSIIHMLTVGRDCLLAVKWVAFAKLRTSAI